MISIDRDKFSFAQNEIEIQTAFGKSPESIGI